MMVRGCTVQLCCVQEEEQFTLCIPTQPTVIVGLLYTVCTRRKIIYAILLFDLLIWLAGYPFQSSNFITIILVYLQTRGKFLYIVYTIIFSYFPRNTTSAQERFMPIFIQLFTFILTGIFFSQDRNLLPKSKLSNRQ
jgi:hypothetical protein